MKSYSKVLSAGLAVCLLLPIAAPALADETDSPSSWAEAIVKTATSFQGLVPSELQCQYQKDTTRAEFAKMAIHFLCARYEYPTFWANDAFDNATVKNFVAYVLEQSQVDGIPRYQKDAFLGNVPEALREEVRNSGWREFLTAMAPFSESSDPGKADDFFYIHAAYVLGIVNGRDDGTFGPDDPITRQEAAAMLDRVCQVFTTEPLDKAELAQYKDEVEVGSWAKASVARMVQHKIMIGTGEDTFSPLSHYTREQCIVTYYRLFENPSVKIGNCVTQMDEKLADAFHEMAVDNRWDTDDAIVITGVSTVGTMHGGHLDSTHLYILYRSESKEDIHISNGGVMSDFSLSQDEQYVYYWASRNHGNPEPYRIHIQTGEIEALK